MGLFSFLRRRDEQAIPKPGTPAFEAAVRGSAIPDSQSVAMGESGWTNLSSSDEALRQLGIDQSKSQIEHTNQTIDLRGTGTRGEVEKVLREHGIDSNQQQTIDASQVPGLRDALLAVLMGAGVRIPNSGGFGGGISAPKQDPLTQIEFLAKKRNAGQISEAEFEAQKKRLLGE
jgi:hypothetical protein